MSRPGKILVADHQGALDKFVCRVLGEEHWYIYHVENTVDLERLVYTNRPDIVILNAHLPQLAFENFTNHLIQSLGDQRPYVCLAISKNVETFLHRDLHRFFDEILVAPFYGVELITKIQTLMRHQEHKTKNVTPEVAKPPTIPRAEPIKSAAASAHATMKQYPKPRLVTPKSKVQKAAEITREQEPVSGVRKRMSALVCRIDGLETIIEEHEQDTSASMIQKIYDAIRSEVSRLGGHVTSFQGDIVVCVFQTSTMFPNHRISAVQAAMQLQLVSMFINEHLLNRTQTKSLGLSCVLHTAMLTMAKYDTQDQKGTTVVGSILPLSLRLLEQCPPATILGTQEFTSEIKRYIYCSEDYVLHDGAGSQGIGFNLITGINTKEFQLHGEPVFKVVK